MNKMTDENQLRNHIAKIVLITHVAFVAWLFVLFLLKGFLFAQLMELGQLLLPVNAAYVMSIMKYIAQNRHQTETPVLHTTELFAKFAKQTLYFHILSLVALITIHAFLKPFDFSVLKYAITLIETTFGVYVGLFVNSLFKTEEKD